MLNPRLYGALRHRCGEVRVVNEGAAFKSTFDSVLKRIKVVERGETYYTNCPLCHDAKQRLAVSHAWLTQQHGILAVNLARCFNENCPVTNREFYSVIQHLMVGPPGEDAANRYKETAPVVRPAVVWRLPFGFSPLTSLPADHPALEFLARKYVGFDPAYLTACYGVGFTDQFDTEYRLARNRIIFPIYNEGVLRGWQGRTIIPDETVRWYLPPGFNKAVARFFWDRIAPNQIPVLTEGIPTAIAAGPTGIPIFGKELGDTACAEIAKRWRTVVIALDPETQVPDPRGNPNAPKVYSAILKERLDKHLGLPAVCIRYPDDVMKRAHEKVNKRKEDPDVMVPDLADFGIVGTNKLISTLPHPWGSLAIL